MKKKKKKKRKINYQKIFCFCSFIFILVCILWYGGRFIYLYLDNHKSLTDKSTATTTFASKLIDNNYNSENFKQINKNYYFYGSATNNYVSYSNLLWRIVKINEDNSIMLITDSIIGTLAFGDSNSTYQESNLITWLNNKETGKFINVLNNYEKYLNITSTCIDNITNIENITCNNVNKDNYLGLLSIEDYINTGGNNSFINNEKYNYLANKNDNNEIWYITNEGKLNTTDGDDILGIKATITISSTTNQLSGTGSIEDPYKFEDNNGYIGSYVKLDEDIWRIYEEKDNIIKLVLDDNIKEDNENIKYNYSKKTYYHNDTNYGSLAYYLNKTYYNTLNYNKTIIENTYVNGLYGKENNYDYKDITSKTIETKISIPSLDDVIFNDSLSDYFTNTGKDENNEAVYLRRPNGTVTTKLVTTESNIVPCISINKEKLIIGTGTKTDPYRMEQ